MMHRIIPILPNFLQDILMIHLKHQNNKTNYNVNILEELFFISIWEKEYPTPKHVRISSEKLYQIINFRISLYHRSFLSVQNIDTLQENMIIVQNVIKNLDMQEMSLIQILDKNTLQIQKSLESSKKKKYKIKHPIPFYIYNTLSPCKHFSTKTDRRSIGLHAKYLLV